MVLVCCALVYYLWHNGQNIIEMVSGLAAWQLLLAWICILVGKATAFYVMSASLRLCVARPLNWRTRAWIYSSADVSKYAGGMWALAGRLIHYRDNRLSVSEISYALLLENGTFIGTSILCGLPVLMILFLPKLTLAEVLCLVGAVLVIAIFVAIILHHRKISLLLIFAGAVRMAKAACVMIIGWMMMGTSLFLILPDVSGLHQWLWSVGAYASAFAVGMLAFFAPAGAGVREAMIALTAHVQGLPAAIVLNAAIVNRALWVVADCFVFAVIALCLRRKSS